VVVGDAFGAELDAGIGAFADELEFEAEDEVGVVAGGAEEFVTGDFSVEVARHDGALLDAEGFVGIAFPAAEGFAIEERPYRSIHSRLFGGTGGKGD
jgi:hypothetical protein